MLPGNYRIDGQIENEMRIARTLNKPIHIHVFRGSIYVKGHYGMDVCRQEFYANDFNGATFVVRIGDCGMRRIRQVGREISPISSFIYQTLQPHGMNYVLTFVTNFHPHFMTKIDRAYNVRCFYAYVDKTVNTDMEVCLQIHVHQSNYSNLPSESLEQQATLMPELRYGMLIRNCNAIDSTGMSIAIIDERGCPQSLPVQLRPIVYDPSLSSAYMVVEAFVFPDRSNVQFQCQVQICDRRDNECLGLTPPNCPLVTRGEFEPNSVIDSSVNPTQVMATFEGTLRSGIGNAILDGTLHQPSGFISFSVGEYSISGETGRTCEFETMNPWRKEQDGMADDDNKTETKTHTKTVITEEKNFKARQTTLKMLTTETTPEETTSYRIPPTEVNLFHWTIPVIPDISNDRPLEIFVKSTSPAPNTQALYERTGRRLADQIIDVMTEELTLRPVDDPPSSTVAAESLPVPSSPQLTCLNQTAMFTLFGAFAITALFSTVFITYLFRDVCRSSEAVSDSIDRRGDLPIYTRRLGDPTYVVTTRSYQCV
uniref:ZP domain-containing protein n=1 Tax=Angiostrongylus cantonensis TaxID=6313 RepID=A0A158P771_ANGCA